MGPSFLLTANRALETYKHAVRKNFSFLKQTQRLDELFAKGLSLSDSAGYLLPVCELHRQDNQLIAKLAEWRAANAGAYFSQFPVTLDGTAAWLRAKLLEVEDRLLFLVIDQHGYPVGHLGYANCLNDEAAMEIDNVVRGNKQGPPGLMSRAMIAGLAWAEDVIGPREIFLRVFSDNDHAVNFYRRLGFLDDIRLPLRKQVEGEVTYYRPCAENDPNPPDKICLRMVYTRRRGVDGSELILTAGPSISARKSSDALDAARPGWNHNRNVNNRRDEAPSMDHKAQVISNIRQLGADTNLQAKSISWLHDSARHKYSYNFTWLGRPIIQYPQDIIAMQELIWSIRPNLIIETGIAHGGSLMLSASMLELNAVSGGPPDARVFGVDIDIRAHNRQAIEAHPMFKRISMIQGSSIAPEIIEQVRAQAAGKQRVLVFLDSNHTHDHVLAELQAYAPLVSVGRTGARRTSRTRCRRRATARTTTATV
jgi:cephalosporin hydroxylase/RimJ/RimL family protein N-acetyltransferase